MQMQVILVVGGVVALAVLALVTVLGLSALRLSSKFSRDDEKKTELYMLKNSNHTA